MKIRGLRIELGEVEAQLLDQPEVRQAVALADESPAGTRLLAYVALQPGEQLDAATLRQRLARRLPDYMLPSAVRVMDALPLNANGKVDRKALPAVPLEGGSGEAPQGELESALAAAWADALALPRVGRHDDFFELGGHSLLALRLLERVRALGYAPPVRLLFQHPTVAAFAQALGEAEAAPPAARRQPPPKPPRWCSSMPRSARASKPACPAAPPTSPTSTRSRRCRKACCSTTGCRPRATPTSRRWPWPSTAASGWSASSPPSIG